MANIVHVKQGSPEWHEYRRTRRNASETPAVLGVSPWQTPYQLWQTKTGRTQAEAPSPAMQHGTRTEPLARSAYELQTGLVMEPIVLEDGEYSASLDGMTLDGSLILEIKCPYKGRDSALWKAADQGVVPDYYGWQIQHQLMLSQAEVAHLFVFTEEQAILLEVKPTADRWPSLRDSWDRFMQFVATSTPPPLAERDSVERSDSAWLAAAAEFLRLHGENEAVCAALASAKRTLLDLATHASQRGGGVSVSRYWKSGAIDYKRLAEASGIDAEQFRQPGREESRIALTR